MHPRTAVAATLKAPKRARRPPVRSTVAVTKEGAGRRCRDTARRAPARSSHQSPFSENVYAHSRYMISALISQYKSVMPRSGVQSKLQVNHHKSTGVQSDLCRSSVFSRVCVDSIVKMHACLVYNIIAYLWHISSFNFFAACISALIAFFSFWTTLRPLIILASSRNQHRSSTM